MGNLEITAKLPDRVLSSWSGAIPFNSLQQGVIIALVWIPMEQSMHGDIIPMGGLGIIVRLAGQAPYL
jgi:hypothetical protein